MKRDLKKAAQLYESCVSSGHLNSIYELGMCYYSGHGVARDEDKALVLLDKAYIYLYVVFIIFNLVLN